MTPVEEDQVLQMLAATAEVMGTELKPSALMLMAKDLFDYDYTAVMHALTRCRRELSGRLTLKAILDVLAPGGGWLSANEAWSLALPAADERNSVVWTAEASKAWQVALPLIDAGDKVGARMAFNASYDRLVAEAKNAGKHPQHEVSAGWDASGRDVAIESAQRHGLLPKPDAPTALSLPSPGEEQQMETNRERIAKGLRELASSLSVSAQLERDGREKERSERMRHVNQRFDERKAALSAQLKELQENERNESA